MSETNFIRLIRRVIDEVVEGPMQSTLTAMNAAIAAHEQAHREFTQNRANLSVVAFQDPFSRQHFLDTVKRLEELRLVADLARDGRRQLAGLERVTPEVQRALSGYLCGLKTIEMIEREAASDRALGKLSQGNRDATLAAQKQSLLSTIDRMCALLQKAGWEPSSADWGVIGGERKRLGGMKKAA